MNNLHFCSPVSLKSLDALLRKTGPYAMMLAAVDEDKYLYVSETMQEIDGYDPKLHRKGGIAFMQSIVHPDDYAAYLQHFIYQLKNSDKEQIQQDLTGKYIYRVRHARGHYCWLSHAYVFLDFEAGRPTRILNLFKNTSQEQGREAFLLEQLQKELPANRFSKVMAAYNQLREDFCLAGTSAPAAGLQLPVTSEEPVKITKREMEILKFISNGFSDKQIASQLSISNHTAINHRKNLIHKYGAKNTAELIKVASKNFWL